MGSGERGLHSLKCQIYPQGIDHSSECLQICFSRVRITNELLFEDAKLALHTLHRIRGILFLSLHSIRLLC